MLAVIEFLGLVPVVLEQVEYLELLQLQVGVVDELVDVVLLHEGEIITLVEQDDNIVLLRGHMELIKLVGDMGVLPYLDLLRKS